MATIAGSQFGATAPGLDVHVVETTTGTGLPGTLASPPTSNLEIYVGSVAGAPALAAGYQGLAILSPSGNELDLVNGAYAVTDYGSGLDTLSAYGGNETIAGNGAAVTLNLYGDSELAQGGGQDTINVYGNADTVNGAGTDSIDIFGSYDTINGSTGNDTIAVGGSFNTVNIGGYDTVNLSGSGDTVTAGALSGANQGLVTFAGTDQIFADGPNVYADTVVGFSQTAGDRIALTGTDTVANSTQVGSDTLITLSDSSTILLKGITKVDNTFFS